MRRRDLPLVTVDLRHAGELVAHPCSCEHSSCTLADHIWRSTLDMRPGLRAQNTDPKVRAWSSENGASDDETYGDGTDSLHIEFRRLLAAAQRSARDLCRFIDAHRPDRTIPISQLPIAANEDWCRVCLDYGFVAPRHRGDLCRDCYDFDLAYRFDRPGELVVAKHEGRRITQQMVDAAVGRYRKQRRHRRRTVRSA